MGQLIRCLKCDHYATYEHLGEWAKAEPCWNCKKERKERIVRTLCEVAAGLVFIGLFRWLGFLP